MSRRAERAKLCPHPSKRRYATVDDAREAFKADMNTWVVHRDQFADYAYLCVCRWWHRTKKRMPGGVPLDD